MPKKAKSARAPTYIQISRVWRKVDPVERRTMAKARTSIRPHPRHRSRTPITGNSTVCERNPSTHPILDHFFSEYRHLCRSRSCPRGPSSQQERTEHYGREQIELEVDRVCHSQTIPPWGQGFCRCLGSAQICHRGSLFYPGELRGMFLFTRVLPTALTGVPANQCK